MLFGDFSDWLLVVIVMVFSTYANFFNQRITVTTFSVAFDRILHRDQMEIAIAKIAKHLPCFMEPGRIFVARFFVAIFFVASLPHFCCIQANGASNSYSACLKVSQH